MVFGDTRKARIQLNEDTVWSGEKRERSNPEAPKAVPEIRRLLHEGHPAQAQAFADEAMIAIPRALPIYQTLGDLWLDFGGDTAEPVTYRRELDLDTGIASVRYTVGGVDYLRPSSYRMKAMQSLLPSHDQQAGRCDEQVRAGDVDPERTCSAEERARREQRGGAISRRGESRCIWRTIRDRRTN